jgi:hypothetical protein
MSIGSPVSGAAAVVGGAGAAGGATFATGGAATVGGPFGFVVTVVDVARRVVVVVAFGFGRVVVVVDVDVVVVGAGLIVSTFSRSVPQALPETSTNATKTFLMPAISATDRSGMTAETGGYFPDRPPAP